MSTEELSAEMRDLISHIARLDFNDFSSFEIQQGMGLTADELSVLRAHSHYDEQNRTLKLEAMQTSVRQKDLLQKIKTRALQNTLIVLEDDTSNGDMALRAALTAEKLLKTKDDDPMHRVQTPGGAITLELPIHIVGVLQAVDTSRIEAQQQYMRDNTKNTGMIGAESLKKHLGLEVPAELENIIEDVDYFSVSM